jgi:hypothetical protein
MQMNGILGQKLGYDSWETTNQMLSNQLTKIKTSFGQSTTAVEHHFKYHFLYSKLVYNVSREDLKFIRGEEVRSQECSRNLKMCGWDKENIWIAMYLFNYFEDWTQATN